MSRLLAGMFISSTLRQKYFESLDKNNKPLMELYCRYYMTLLDERFEDTRKTEMCPIKNMVIYQF